MPKCRMSELMGPKTIRKLPERPILPADPVDNTQFCSRVSVPAA